MKTHKAAVLFTFLILLPLLFSSLALADFTLSSESGYSLCPCSGQGYYLLVSNYGPSAESYTLAVNTEAASWITLSPSSFELQAGQAAQVLVTVNTECGVAGLFPFTIYAFSSGGVTKALSQDVTISDSCYGYSVERGKPTSSNASATEVAFTPDSSTATLCTEAPITIPLKITNKDKLFGNTYTASANVPWAKIFPSTFSLPKNSYGVVLLTLHPSQSDIGTKNITLSFSTETGKKAELVSFPATAAQCYGLSVSFPEHPETFCSGVLHTVNASISNKGIYAEHVNITLSPNWAVADATTADLAPSSTRQTFISFTAPDATSGTHEITLSAASTSTAGIFAAATLPFLFEPKSSCYQVSIETSKDMTSRYEEAYSGVTVKNTGSEPVSLSLSLDGPSWLSLDEEALFLNPNQKHTVTLIARPSGDTVSGEYTATITARGDHFSSSAVVMATIAYPDPVWSTVKFVAYQLRYYVYAFIVILLIALAFFRPLRSSYKAMRQRMRLSKARKLAQKQAALSREAKHEPKKTKEPSPKKEHSLRDIITFTLIGLAVLFSLLLSFFPTVMKGLIDRYLKYVLIGVAAAIALIVVFTLAKNTLAAIGKYRQRRKKNRK